MDLWDSFVVLVPVIQTHALMVESAQNHKAIQMVMNVNAPLATLDTHAFLKCAKLTTVTVEHAPLTQQMEPHTALHVQVVGLGQTVSRKYALMSFVERTACVCIQVGHLSAHATQTTLGRCATTRSVNLTLVGTKASVKPSTKLPSAAADLATQAPSVNMTRVTTSTVRTGAPVYLTMLVHHAVPALTPIQAINVTSKYVNQIHVPQQGHVSHREENPLASVIQALVVINVRQTYVEVHRVLTRAHVRQSRGDSTVTVRKDMPVTYVR